MNRSILLLGLAAALAGCSREPHSWRYYEARPAEIDRTVKACTAGTVRGKDCDNADLAKAHRADDARMVLFRSAFRGR